MQQIDQRDPSSKTLRGPRPSAPLLARASQLFATQVGAVLRPAAITPDQWSVLAHLLTHRHSSMSELSAASGITGPTLTRVVDALTQRALTYRNVDPSDRRRVLVHLSARGQALAEELRPQVEAAEDGLLADLTADEVVGLAELLARVVVAHGQGGSAQ